MIGPRTEEKKKDLVKRQEEKAGRERGGWDENEDEGREGEGQKRRHHARGWLVQMKGGWRLFSRFHSPFRTVLSHAVLTPLGANQS